MILLQFFDVQRNYLDLGISKVGNTCISCGGMIYDTILLAITFVLCVCFLRKSEQISARSTSGYST